MPKTGAKPRARTRGSKTRSVHVGAPTLETRSRQILAAIVEEATAEPSDLKLPDPDAALGPVVGEASAPIDVPQPAQPEKDESVQTIDELATRDLVSIVRHGASLEVDGSKYTSGELTLLAENVAGEAHLKINNSGAFSAGELAAIAKSTSGQVIFA